MEKRNQTASKINTSSIREIHRNERVTGTLPRSVSILCIRNY